MNKKDLLVKIHAYIASDGIIDTWKSKDIHGRKLRIRDKLRIRFYNKEEKLIKDFISIIRELYPHIKYIRYSKKRSEVEIRSQIISKDILKLGEASSKNWEVPKEVNNKQKLIWIGAFVDCDGTVYNKNYNRYVTIDSINLNGLKQISLILDKFGISNKIYTIKYKDNTSYRLKISKRENLSKFNKLIKLRHSLKKRKLNEAIKSYR